jgi:hypothetical protein
VLIFMAMSPAYTKSANRNYGRAAARHTVRSPGDWEACERPDLVRHVPTNSMFQVYPRPGKAPDEFLDLEDFLARLVHVCEGTPPPMRPALEVLSREAALMALHFLGMVKLIEPPDGGSHETSKPPSDGGHVQE